MVQKILSDKVMNERTNAYYSYYLGERNISVLPLNVYDPPERFIAYIKKNRENLNITLSDFELEQIISGMRLKAQAFLVPLEKISWIAGSERACLFSWYLLMQFIQKNRAKINCILKKSIWKGMPSRRTHRHSSDKYSEFSIFFLIRICGMSG